MAGDRAGHGSRLAPARQRHDRAPRSPEATERQVPWRELAGFRNVRVHGYPGVDLEAVWGVVAADLPPLAAALQRMRARADPPHGGEAG